MLWRGAANWLEYCVEGIVCKAEATSDLPLAAFDSRFYSIHRFSILIYLFYGKVAFTLSQKYAVFFLELLSGPNAIKFQGYTKKHIENLPRAPQFSHQPN